MNKLLEYKNFEFEVLSSNEESIIYKRVLNKRLPDKEKRKREMQLPKLKVHFFESEDLDNLQEILIRASERIEQEKKESIKSKILSFSKFLMK